MKKTKIGLHTSILIGIVLIFLYGCDTLVDDGDALDPTVATIKGKDDLYVLSNGTAFIDLNTTFKMNKPAKLSVTSPVRLGTLSDLGGGLLQYSPGVRNKKATDSFELTAFSDKNEILMVDTITINIENDSTHLPCGLYPVADSVFGVRKNVPAAINVLQNDYLCRYDSTDLVVSIYQSGSAPFPRHGNAVVEGHYVIYTAGNTFVSEDQVIYKISVKNDPSVVAYGIIYLYAQSECSITLTNDYYAFNDLKETFFLAAFGNDMLCDSANLAIRISQPPFKGKASLQGGGFLYTRLDSIRPPNFVDYFTYEVCKGGSCKTAVVQVTIQASSACVLKAVADTLDFTTTTDTLKYARVLNNDTVCDSLRILRITQAPVHGRASVFNNAIEYRRESGSQRSDSFEYEICDKTTCRRAKVYVKLIE